MNPPENSPNPIIRQITIVLCTEYNADGLPIVITYLPEGVQTIPEQQKHPRTVRVAYERFQTEQKTFVWNHDSDGNII